MEKHILLVDDDPLVLKSLTRLLSTTRYQIEAVKNGREALEKCSLQTFDLAICDIRMPGVDGIEFGKQLRELDRTRNCMTPLIFITGYASEQAPIEALRLKAVDYVLKPFDIDQLMSIVSKTLKQSEKTATPS